MRLLRAIRAVVLDESAGGLILRLQGLGRALDGGEDLLGQDLAQLDAPLIEGVDTPHGTLNKGDVLVQGDQLAQDRRGQGRGHDRGRGTIAGEHAGGDDGLGRALGAHLLAGLAEGQGLRLGEEVR